MTLAARLLLLLALAAPLPAGAVQPDEVLPDAALEARARDIGKHLRCLVCQNQSIDDSDADLARDLRILVRERLTQGDSDAAVMSYITARYGEFVLLKPPFRPATWLLWFGPGAILLLSLCGIAIYLRRRAASSVPPPDLSDDERRRLADLLKDRG
jgi:cytochrome c-type biogenesis protein CcmH